MVLLSKHHGPKNAKWGRVMNSFWYFVKYSHFEVFLFLSNRKLIINVPKKTQNIIAEKTWV